MSGGFTVRRCAASWGSRTGSSTTGPAPGLLQPSVAAAKGSGSRRVYSYSDVLELKVIKQLLDAGVSLQSARRAVECLRQDLGADLASANLVLTGTSSVLARSNGEVVDLLAGGQGVFNIVPLAGVVEELDADIVRPRHGRRRRPSRTGPARPRCRPRGPPGSDRGGPRAHRAHAPSGLCARRAGPLRPSLRAPLRRAARPVAASAGSTSRSSSRSNGTARGSPVSGFRPDFYLPGRGVFIELTTADQRLVTRKNRKVRRMRELYPEVPDLRRVPARLHGRCSRRTASIRHGGSRSSLAQ